MTTRSRVLLLGLAALMAAPAVTFATNGYFAIGYGMKSRGMGGVGVAYAQDSMAAAANPAGMAWVGTRIDVGAEFFHPPRRVAANGDRYGFHTPTSVVPPSGTVPVAAESSGSNLFLIPTAGANYQFNRKMSVGMSVIGNGANTRYMQNFFNVLDPACGSPSEPKPCGALGVQLMQMQMLPTVAYKLTPTQSIGASLIIGVQTFRAYGLGDFAIPQFAFSSDTNNMTNKGNDWSYGGGARVGWLGNFFDDRVSLGAMYSSRVYMTRFKKYGGLFAQDGSFDIPALYAVGLALKPNDRWVFAADVQRVLYNSIASVGNRHSTGDLNDPCSQPIGAPGCTNGEPKSHALGASDGWGFGWKNQTAYKVGVSYKWNDNLVVRTGFNYGKSPIPDDQLLFNMLAPAVTEKHFTTGFTYSLSRATEINVSYVHAFKHSQTCEAPTCKTLLTQGPGAYVAAEMYYDALGASLSLKF